MLMDRSIYNISF